MKILIIQHELHTPPGNTLLWLENREIDFKIICADREPLPEPSKFDGLIVLGGGLNVDQESKHPWLKKEKEFILSWIKSEKPLLGICLGGQLIAEVLGARVSAHEFWEIGWSDLDVLMGSGLPSEGKVIPAFQWHGYSFDIPKGANLVINGKQWANQGFRFKNHVLGLQFHPEADQSFIEECAHAQQRSQKVSATMLSSDQILQRLSDKEALKIWYFALLDRHFLQK